MVKHKKQALNVAETEKMHSNRQAIDYSLPVHSKQAAFSLLYLLVFSVMMFSLPFGMFFATKHILEEKFDITGFLNTCYSVFAAVVTVNVIIILYAIVAYRETEYDDDGAVINQKPKRTELNKKLK